MSVAEKSINFTESLYLMNDQETDVEIISWYLIHTCNTSQLKRCYSIRFIK